MTGRSCLRTEELRSLVGREVEIFFGRFVFGSETRSGGNMSITIVHHDEQEAW